jgi:threonine/homoserine/homoserine lactone efflux protein
MTLSAIGLFAGAILALALSPGPTAVALVARVLTQGGWSVLPFTLALWIGEALLLTATLLGLSVVLQQLGWALVAVKWAGVLFLVYFAWRMWFDRRDQDANALPTEHSRLKLFLAGLAVTFTNPKIIAFYLALLPAIIDFDQISFGDWVTLTTTLIVVLAMIDIFYIVLAETARRRIRTTNRSFFINRCGALAIGSAAVMIAMR